MARLIKELPHDRTYLCCCVLKKHIPAFNDAFDSLGLRQEFETTTLLYHLPKAEALQFQVNPTQGVCLKKLEEQDIPQIDLIYPFKSDETPILFSKLIRYNANLGAYNATDGELMAWCMRNNAGILTALQVEEQHKRRGLAELLLKAMAQKIAEMGDDTSACIVLDNLPSLKLFEKVGFQNTGVEIVWMGYDVRSH